MYDIATDDDTFTNDSKSSMITWDSLYNEINSLGCPSEISMLEITSIIDKYKNIANNEYSDDYDDDNYNYDDDNYNYDNYDQDSSDWINPDNLESPEVDDDKENEEIVDETLLPEKFRGKKWIIKKILGEGSFFRVSQAYADGILLAIRKRHFGDYQNVYSVCCHREIEKEYRACKRHVIDVLSKIGYHDNIATFFGFRRIGFRWEMFVEYAGGGDLFDEIMRYIANRKRIPDEVVISRFRDLINAVAYLHKRKIAHLDIKVENCLLTKWGSLKLSDFDCAIIFNDNTKVSPRQLGTKAYSPPQRFYTSIKPECADIWSCGIILFSLLAYRLPWIGAYCEDPSYLEWYKYINGKYIDGLNSTFPFEFPKNTNSKFLDLLEQLLDPNEGRRIRMEDIVDISWLQIETYHKSFEIDEDQQSNKLLIDESNIFETLRNLKIS